MTAGDPSIISPELETRNESAMELPLWVVCHERRVSCLRRATIREMKEGPSSSGIRSRSQATASCCGQKPWWRALRKRRDKISAGTVERGERKRTAAEGHVRQGGVNRDGV